MGGTLAYHNALEHQEQIREIMMHRFREGEVTDAQFRDVFGDIIDSANLKNTGIFDHDANTDIKVLLYFDRWSCGGILFAILGLLIGFLNIIHWLSLTGIMIFLPKLASKFFIIDD
ncbi:hypothetical protein [Rhodovulum sulfidophilum]|uniref:hypothetical protein n=1 Tax=Rhodovulum sulfidophilum TaxID=35806 RepID=UPI001F4006EC|nr:hypothetical protein [Rhodovulum sulfidophilum]MCE8433104.1 hypothetical protein [Rhodovulum sulfidophilum]